MLSVCSVCVMQLLCHGGVAVRACISSHISCIMISHSQSDIPITELSGKVHVCMIWSCDVVCMCFCSSDDWNVFFFLFVR